jgi:5-oxopent-3-ene-1,2,5-tricarboxylate decarboxylase/2-hydroxyhepta-2,4-diene-1,7-dioate isomerase
MPPHQVISDDAVTRTSGRRPGKVVAVHLDYPSRAAQRGRAPTAPSYFLKPSSSSAGCGRVERPGGETEGEPS